METGPKKNLELPGFAAQSARGILRDQSARRWTMFALLVAAMAMLFLGSTFLREFLNPREHAVLFIIYWLSCAWLTLTALLLAIFDVLLVRAAARAARRALRETAAEKEAP